MDGGTVIIAHNGILSPHVLSMLRLLWRCDETLMQEIVLPGQTPVMAPDLVFMHGFHERPAELEKFLSWGVPVVVRPWNDRWMSKPGYRQRMLQLLAGCALVVGSPFSALKAECPVPWQDVTTLVDTDVFKPVDGLQTEPEIPFFAARILRDDPEGLYWGDEILRAFAGLDLAGVSGHASPNQMADQLRRANVVLSLCGAEWGPSETTLEAVFSGKVPVVSDTPAIRQHFEEGGVLVGARLAERSPRSIRQAVADVLALTPEQKAVEVERNLRYFAGWSLQAQAERIGGAVLECYYEARDACSAHQSYCDARSVHS